MTDFSDNELRVGFADTDKSLLDGSVDGVEIDDYIFWLVDEVAENCVYATSCVLDYNALVHRCMHELCKAFSGFIEEIDVLIAEKLIRTGFCELCVASFGVADRDGICAKAAMIQIVPFGVEKEMGSHGMAEFGGHGPEITAVQGLGSYDSSMTLTTWSFVWTKLNAMRVYR